MPRLSTSPDQYFLTVVIKGIGVESASHTTRDFACASGRSADRARVAYLAQLDVCELAANGAEEAGCASAVQQQCGGLETPHQ
eukprot:324797-Pleurochrysis_carterae.AAC.1